MTTTLNVRPSRLRDSLQNAGARGREIEDVIAMAMHQVTRTHRLNAQEAVGGLVGNIVAVVQARTMPGEWRDVGDEICAEIMRRLTERG